MTITFTGYDRSPECAQFCESVKQAQGFVSSWRYPKGKSPAYCELIAFVPEQLTLKPSTPPKPHETHSC